MGKFTLKIPFSIAMLNYQRVKAPVDMVIWWYGDINININHPDSHWLILVIDIDDWYWYHHIWWLRLIDIDWPSTHISKSSREVGNCGNGETGVMSHKLSLGIISENSVSTLILLKYVISDHKPCFFFPSKS